MPLKLLPIIFFFALSLSAQESPIATNENPESEVSITINPNNSDNLIVAAINDFNSNGQSNNSRLSIYYSNDFGDSWNLSTYNGTDLSSSPTRFIGDPVLTFDTNGKAYLTHLLWEYENTTFNAYLYLASSTDGGQSWTPQQLISAQNFVLDKPWIVTDISPISSFQNQVYIAYIESANFDYQLNLIKKEAGSNTVSTNPVQIHTEDFDVVQFPDLHTDRSGNLYVSFVGHSGVNTALYVAKSTDGGNSFSEEVQVADLRMYNSDFNILTPIDRTGLNRLYPSPHIKVDHSDGDFDNRIYVTWTDKEEGFNDYGLDVYLSFSDDFGASWSSPKLINSDGAVGKHNYYSTLEVSPEGQLVICWYDRRDDMSNKNTHYYMALSKDGGASFEQELPLTGVASDFSSIGLKNNDFGIGEYTQIVSTNEFAIPVWADGRSNNGDIRLYQAKVSLDTETAVIEQQAISEQFKVSQPFPNPAKDDIHWEVELKNPSDIVVKIGWLGDARWTKIISKKNGGVGRHLMKMNLETLADGVYWYIIQTDFGEKHGKLVISN